MTVHKKQSQKRRKSKIILPLQTNTTLLPKKRKTATNKKKTDKTKTDIYTKIKLPQQSRHTKHQKYSSNSTQSP
jgi:hypothetical protein